MSIFKDSLAVGVFFYGMETGKYLLWISNINNLKTYMLDKQKVVDLFVYHKYFDK